MVTKRVKREIVKRKRTKGGYFQTTKSHYIDQFLVAAVINGIVMGLGFAIGSVVAKVLVSKHAPQYKEYL